MADNTLLRQLLIFEEGIELKAYRDSEKKLWHIGIGHLLEIEQSDEELEVLGDTFDHDEIEGLTITEEQAYDLFDIDVQDAIDDVYPFFTEEQLDALTPARRAVVISMVFQQGGAGVRKYKNFKRAVIEEDWDDAAHEMVTGSKGGPSRWMAQTPERCQRAADAMRTGVFEMFEDDKESIIDSPISLADVPKEELLAEISRRMS